MDEVFRVNSPQSLSVNEIKLTDDEDDPFSLDSKPTADSSVLSNVNIQPNTSIQKLKEEPSLSYKNQVFCHNIHYYTIFI